MGPLLPLVTNRAPSEKHPRCHLLTGISSGLLARGPQEVIDGAVEFVHQAAPHSDYIALAHAGKQLQDAVKPGQRKLV